MNPLSLLIYNSISLAEFLRNSKYSEIFSKMDRNSIVDDGKKKIRR